MFKSWLNSFQFDKAPAAGKDALGFLFVLGDSGEGAAKIYDKLIKTHALTWQAASLKKNTRELVYFIGKRGPVWILRARKAPSKVSHEGRLEESSYAWFRDNAGGLVSHFKAHHLGRVGVEFHASAPSQILGSLTGFEIASYSFKDFGDGKEHAGLPKMSVKMGAGKVDRSIVKEAGRRGRAVTLARHLVCLPPNELNPKTYASLVKDLDWPSTVKIDVWDEKRLAKEGMGLHLAVGRGAEHAPCMVHIRYRPSGKSILKPVAFVGKGITFDTGGLDIKPSSGMRLMKKDMGGSAAVVAAALWAAESGSAQPLDIYLALAENAVDARAFRPSDVVTARSGTKVEIDNTDAEGRLVLADSLDVAVTQKGADEPEVVINVATLTGAIKVALGADVAGLFSNDDALAESISRAGQMGGDLCWRMPLVDKYFGSLSSPFAEFKNSSEGFGGAITAALFLQKFVKGKRWAHLDIYAWADKASGPIAAAGGSGQAVQCLIEWISARTNH